MKKLLIVSPNFPPLNAADMHRVRTSLPFFRQFGWDPHVLCVAPAYLEGLIEPRLLSTVPSDIPITRTAALPLRVSRCLGFGNVALRAFAHLYAAGADIIARERIDLTYFSTTMFAAMPLGRLWKWRFGTPYVLDMQDPWVSDRPAPVRLPKHRQATLMHRLLESFTMGGVDGLIAVSAAYHEALRRRYPWIAENDCATLPFGANAADFEEASRAVWLNAFFERDDGQRHAVYVGAMSADMRLPARILFRAARKVQALQPALPKLRLTFVGTSYAPAGRQTKSAEPEAATEGMGDAVQEWPDRVPYFDALRLMQDSHFIIVLGSSDQRYTPSKLHQAFEARRPIIAVVHEHSPVLELLRRSRAGVFVTFRGPEDIEASAAQLSQSLLPLIEREPRAPAIDWSVLEGYRADRLAGRQCELFDSILQSHAVTGRVASAPHGG
ncbi:MAG: glycosyltransferase [Vicinamibacterales bacterium]